MMQPARRQHTELECGVRMADYMIFFRSIDFQQTREIEIIERLKGYVAREKKFKGDLAAKRRNTIHTHSC